MKKHNMELAVGVFVLIGLVCIGYMTVKLGKMELFSKHGYTIYANFNSVTGLRPGAAVEMSGVPVGKVTSIRLNPKNQTRAVVIMRLNDDIQLAADSTAAIKTSGLIGDKYVNITRGNSETVLKDGEELDDTESVIDIEAIISSFMFGGGRLENLTEKGYELKAAFNSAAGLGTGASVEIAGVPVGKVKEITLGTHHQAVVTMILSPTVKLSDDTIASIKSSGILGGKYINLSLGGSDTILQAGDEITDTESSIDLEAMISKYVFGGVSK